MDIQNRSAGLDALLQKLVQNKAQTSEVAQNNTQAKKRTAFVQDEVRLRDSASQLPPKTVKQSGFSLQEESTQNTENGFRRVQQFQQGEKSFTRIEEITTEPDRTKRIVIQHNDSGSATVFEDIIDRLEDGSFRNIQRFTDENGDTKTNVNTDFDALEANLRFEQSSRSQGPSNNDNPFPVTRGTQVNLSV